MSGLLPDQLDFYNRHGYLLLENVLPVELFRPLINELNQRIDQKAQEAHEAGCLHDLFKGETFEKRLLKICDSIGNVKEDPDFWPFWGENYKSPAMFAIITHPLLLTIVESAIGPEILAHPQFNLRAKLPYQDVSSIYWHQDAGYLDVDAEETDMVNFWIPLVDTTVENGCMEVISGSHIGPIRNHVKIPGYNFRGIIEENLPSGDRVRCPIQLGGILLTRHKTVHRSLLNKTDHIRWSLDLRYSNSTQPSGRDNVPGFIAMSVDNPGAVARSLDDWLKLFDD